MAKHKLILNNEVRSTYTLSSPDPTYGNYTGFVVVVEYFQVSQVVGDEIFDLCVLQVAIETIYVAIQTLIYSLLLFSMIGYQWTAAKFFYFYYFIFMCFNYFSMYGMMVVALTPGYQIAGIVMSFFLSFWNLFSGFLVPRPVGQPINKTTNNHFLNWLKD